MLEDKDNGFFFFFKFCDIIKCGNFFRKRFSKMKQNSHQEKKSQFFSQKMAIIYLFLDKEKTLEEEEEA